MFLVSFEGIDGSGKSTQARLLNEALHRVGQPALLVREPGGTPLSEHIRTLLLDPDLHIVPFAELLLFSAARAQLVAEVIRPALTQRRVVIADRFFDSTTAYQGGGRQVAEIDWIRAFNLRVTGGLVPRRTYFLDIPVEEALRRLRGKAPDRMETVDRAFYERVLAVYYRLMEEEPERFLRLDGLQPVEVIHARIWEDMEVLLKEATEQPSG